MKTHTTRHLFVLLMIVSTMLARSVQAAAPIADAQSVTLNEDKGKVITLTGSDADPGTFLSYIIVTPPAHGTLTGTGPTQVFMPEVNYNGTDSFTFMVNDGTQNSALATVSLTINDVAEPSVTGPAFPEFVNPNPTSNDGFGAVIVVLNTGNVVITAPTADIGGVTDCGAVYLFNGSTGALISTLTGSTTNDQVGLSGVTALTNGNFVVRSTNWDNGAITDAGAVTWGNGITGISGTVSAANSFVGSSASDLLGNVAVVALTNGNYVVVSSGWNNGATSTVGAVTWGNGSTGSSGVVSAANSLIGGSASDQVGSGGVTALTNGNYVVSSQNYDSGAVLNVGAVTWGNGSTGISGVVSAANSLIGSTGADQVGFTAIMALNNGNYVVRSANWDSGAITNVGAVTWANGSTGISGVVSAANSLIGSTSNDQVGLIGTALTNGNYVVGSNNWDNGAAVNAGSATWGSGITGIIGVVSTANSLHGTTTNDQVGQRGVIALANGNYVVVSPSWRNGAISSAGAVTWGNGSTGTTGAVSTANSLYGTTLNDLIGNEGITVLTNGNYVVRTANWDNGAIANAGAATWGNGSTGSSGAVSAANSLVGTTAQDQVGAAAYALTNGNYVVSSQQWDNGATTNVGAVTWGNGSTGIFGTITTANSLIGSTSTDRIGSSIVALNNGNYVVRSTLWINGAAGSAGAVTWGNGSTGITGVVSAANSLVGSSANDQVGNDGVIPLPNGHYVVRSVSWDDAVAGIANAGAVTWGNGSTGISGAVSSLNSQVGSIASAGPTGPTLNPLNNHFIIRWSTEQKVRLGSMENGYFFGPTLTSVTPNSGPSAGGTSVTITGTKFTGVTAISFGGTAATSFTVVNPTTIAATTPAHAPGPVSVVVTTSSGNNAANTLFTYLSVAPTNIALSNSSVAENNAANATIGTLSTTDADAGDSFTYTLVTGTGSDDNAAFNLSGNALRLTAAADFETKSSYAVRLRSTDAGGLFFEKAFTISITNVNEMPTVARSNASVTVAEGSDATNTGTFGDPEGAGSVTLSASIGTITPNNGAGTWSWSHTPTDGPASSTVTITANDGVNPAVSVTFALDVTNVAPVFDLGSNATLTAGTGALSRTVSFTDPGADVWSGTVNYGDGGGTSALTVNQGAKTFDLNHTYTTNGTYTVSVTLNDDDGGSLTDTYQVTVLVCDYDITVSGGVLTITDLTGNGDILNFMEWDANVLVVEAIERYFRYDGQTQVDSSGPVPLTGITSIVLNAGEGDDSIVMQGFYLTMLPNLTINGGNGDDAVTISGRNPFAVNASLNVDLQNDSADPGSDSITVDAHAEVIMQGTGSIVMRVSRNIMLDIESSMIVENGSITLEANLQSAPPPFAPSALADSEGEVSPSGPPSAPTTGDFTGILIKNAQLVAQGNGSITLGARGGDAGTSTASVPNAGISLSGSEIYLSGTGHLALTGTSVANGDGAAGVVFDSSNITTRGGGSITLSGSATGTGSGDQRPGIVIGGNRGSDIVANGDGMLNVIATGAPGSGQGNAGLVFNGTGILQVNNGDMSLTGTGGQGAGIVMLGHVIATGDGNVTMDGTGNGTDQPGVVMTGGALNGGGFVIATAEGDVHVTGTGTGTGASLILDSSGHPLVVTEGGGDVLFTGNKIAVTDVEASGEPVAVADGSLSFVAETPGAPNPLVLDPATLALLHASTTVNLNGTLTNHAPTAMTLSNVILDENNPDNTLIGTLGAIDPDLPAQSLTFELTPGAGGDDNAFFTVVGNTLKAAVGLDYEWRPTMNVRLRVSDGSGGAYVGTFTIQVNNLAETPVELWRQQKFGFFTNTGIAADTFDTDGDGLLNIQEFAFNLNPAKADNGQLPQPQRSGTDLFYNFNGVSGVAYRAEWSPDLVQWFPVTDTGSGNTHVFSVPAGTNAQKFMRLIVSQP